MTSQTPVLIVGGSLTGLSAALFLARQGVRCTVVERRSGNSVQYKFGGISPRSMEIFHEAGIEPEIRARVTRDLAGSGVARTKNLSHPQITWLRMTARQDTRDISPILGATLDQEKLEAILKEQAESAGAKIRFHTELMDFKLDLDGVQAWIRDVATQREETITASYLIVADGANGRIRERLGIGRHGAGVLQRWTNVIFKSDLEPTLEGRKLAAAFVTDINGLLVPRGGGIWLLALQSQPECGARHQDLNQETCIALIRHAAGRPDLQATLVDARSWDAAAYVADYFQQGRAFLIGDAAHLMPPTGAFGGNTGIQDGHNLAWKLQMVLRGAAGRRLLETYDAERRPVAERTLAQALARLDAWFQNPTLRLPPSEKILPDETVIFGYLYRSRALIAEEGTSTAKDFENPRTPSGQPGARAPQVILERNTQRIPVLDLSPGRWLLLSGPEGSVWCDAARRCEAAGLFAVSSYRIGVDLHDPERRFCEIYGIAGDGAVLLRPDHFIAWRARASSRKPEMVLRAVLKLLCFRDE